MNRKILGISLLFFLITPIVVTFVVLHYQKKQVKREIKWRMIAGMDKDELILLKLSSAEKQRDLKWEHSKEFEYRGQMYDVVETDIIGDTTYYRCWWDHDETKLNKQLKELVSNAMGNNPMRKQNQNRLQQFYRLLYIPEPSPDSIFYCQEQQTHQSFVLFSFSTIYHSPPSAPPEFC